MKTEGNETEANEIEGGARYEPSTSVGGHTQRRFHSRVGWQARKLECQRPSLCGLGDLSPQGIARRSQSYLRFAVQRMVWTDDSTLRRRRQNLVPARNAARAAGCPGSSEGREQQVCL